MASAIPFFISIRVKNKCYSERYIRQKGRTMFWQKKRNWEDIQAVVREANDFMDEAERKLDERIKKNSEIAKGKDDTE